MGLNTLLAHPVLAWLELGVNYLEATDVAQVLVLKVFFVDDLSAHDNWRFVTVDGAGDLLLSLDFLFTNSHFQLVSESIVSTKHLLVVSLKDLRAVLNGLLDHTFEMFKYLDSLLVEAADSLKQSLHRLVLSLVLESLNTSVETWNYANYGTEELVDSGTMAEHLTREVLQVFVHFSQENAV